MGSEQEGGGRMPATMGRKGMTLRWLVVQIWIDVSVYLVAAQTNRNAEPLAIRISCGSSKNTYSPSSNKLWVKDFGYSGGTAANASTTSYIAPQLHTLRYFQLSDGPENCYNITGIPRGHYTVRLFFGLNDDVSDLSEPLFDISIEGTQVQSLKPGWTVNDEQSYAECMVYVSDTAVTICFHSTGHGDPSVMTIEILQIQENAYYFVGQKRVILRTVKRVSCGAAESRFGEDYNADPWAGDRFWVGDHTAHATLTTAHAIKHASVAPNFYPEVIYQSASQSSNREPILSYKLEVEPNKNYSIWLHFAEIEGDVSLEGERVFDVLLNGKLLFPNVDIIRISGESFAAVVLNKTVTVNGKFLTLSFRPQKKRAAIINAIEIFEVITMEHVTFKTEVWALQALKNTLGLPLRFGWNGDPCVPQLHPWSGVDCQFSSKESTWFIDGLGLDNQGLKGLLSDDLANLQGLRSINLSGNSIHGIIPPTIGNIDELEILDLSYNMLNGTIPESLGALTHLRKLYLNGNLLTGKVPVGLDGGPIHGASFNFSGNVGLCGIPGLRSCYPHLSAGSKAGIALGVIIGSIFILLCGLCMWKRRQNIIRERRLALRDAPYAKSRTNFVRDVQMSRPYIHEHFRTYTDNVPQ